jgi:hypothetical protein
MVQNTTYLLRDIQNCGTKTKQITHENKSTNLESYAAGIYTRAPVDDITVWVRFCSISSNGKFPLKNYTISYA